MDTVRPDQVDAPPAAATAAPRPDPIPRRRDWQDLPVRAKTTVLIILAAVGGMLAGVIETALGHRGWPLVILFTAAVAAPLHLARRALVEPLERLLHETRHARRMQRPTRPITFPMNHDDEIGRLAELLHDHTLRAYRHARAAKHLRRTLDRRVTDATSSATRHLEQIAMRDPLTGLGNRRFLDAHLEALVTSCRSSDTDLICLALDLDNFKPVNDTLGHAAGDRLLKLLAQLIHGNIRRDDLAIRTGGDEFLVLMPGADPHTAADFADRIRQLFSQHIRTTLPRDLTTGISVGLASLQQDNLTSAASLLDHADRRLYHAKNTGKDRLATDTPST